MYRENPVNKTGNIPIVAVRKAVYSQHINISGEEEYCMRFYRQILLPLGELYAIENKLIAMYRIGGGLEKAAYQKNL
jgi:hypothetical protein